MLCITFSPTSTGSGTSSTTPSCGMFSCGWCLQVKSLTHSFEHVVAYLQSRIICFFKYLFALTVRSNLIPSPPTYNSKYGYLSWESYYNLSYYTRLLPPVPEDCPTPLGVRGLSLFHQAAPINILQYNKWRITLDELTEISNPKLVSYQPRMFGSIARWVLH